MSNLGRAPRRITRKIGLGVTVCMLWMCSLSIAVIGVEQVSSQETNRRLITRTQPEYPDALKKLYIGGVVRVEVQVAPNGSVKNVKLLGGNPILGQSTMKAVKSWKYAPAATDETFTVTLEFDPHK
jgi:TonB family protein